MNQASLNPQTPLAEEHSWVLPAGQGAPGHYFDEHIHNTSPSKTVDAGVAAATPKTEVLFIIGDWNAKVGRQETPGVTGKFDLGVQNEAGERLTEFCQENGLFIANTLFQKHKGRSTYGNHQMVNTEIRLIIFLAVKDRQALYSQQKQDRELTVAQIMNSLMPNAGLN